jgi:hypothetical protein
MTAARAAATDTPRDLAPAASGSLQPAAPLGVYEDASGFTLLHTGARSRC